MRLKHRNFIYFFVICEVLSSLLAQFQINEENKNVNQGVT